MIPAASQARALDGLRRFGERLGGLDSGAVRAVATNTLRVAKNAAEFLPLAEEALGFPIEIIAGREEARLIYIGASHSLPMAAHKRLVVDIGGGSTEFIIGKRHEPQLMESLYMGCVSYTLRFFPDRKIDKKRLREAQIAAAKEIEPIAHDYQRMGWKEAVGSSGTARAIADVLPKPHRKGDGFIEAMWCGDEACEDKVKEVTGVGSRCIPLEQKHISDKCVCCGKPAKHMVYWGRQY